MWAIWIWDVSPAIFTFLDREMRWYGLLFALAFFIGNYLGHYMYRKEGLNTEGLDKLLLYLIFGVVIGARLGHVLFYDPVYYFAHPLKIFYVWEGGLASHGGALGILVATALYCRYNKVPYLRLLDKLVIVVALGGALVRLGNFVNSEIYGLPTGGKYGVVFVRGASEYLERSLGAELRLRVATDSFPVSTTAALQPLYMELRYRNAVIDTARISDFLQAKLPGLMYRSSVRDHLRLAVDSLDFSLQSAKGSTMVQVPVWGVPRHPTQLYEALFYLILFAGLFLWWKQHYTKLPSAGTIFSVFLLLLWGFRFCIEFLKERQEEFHNPLWLNMGQLLSLPLLLVGVALFLYIYLRPKPVA